MNRASSETFDSPRWCDICATYGDHHTDRHRSFYEALAEALAAAFESRDEQESGR